MTDAVEELCLIGVAGGDSFGLGFEHEDALDDGSADDGSDAPVL